MTDPKDTLPILESGIVGVYTGLLVGISLIVGVYLLNTEARIDVIGFGTSIATGLATASVLNTYELKRVQQIPDVELVEETEVILQLQAIGFERHFVAGTAPIVGIAIVTFPFVWQDVFLTLRQATLISLALSLFSLFLFGAWIGAHTNRVWYFSGMRTGIVGVITIVLSSLFV